MNSTTKQTNMTTLAFLPLAIAINIGIGAIVKALNLPLYLDSVGTILTTILLGWRLGAVVGVLGFLITSLIINPFAAYFIFTQVVIAGATGIAARNGWFKKVISTILFGIGLGVLAAIVSAPVIILVFQGATGNGSALVTAFFVKTGHQILNSVFLSGFSIEPLDKVIQCLLVFYILKSIPKTLLSKFPSENLKRNNLI